MNTGRRRPLFQGRFGPYRASDGQLEIVCVSSSDDDEENGKKKTVAVASNKNSVLDPKPKSQSPVKRGGDGGFGGGGNPVMTQSPIRIGFDPEYDKRKEARSKVGRVSEKLVPV